MEGHEVTNILTKIDKSVADTLRGQATRLGLSLSSYARMILTMTASDKPKEPAIPGRKTAS